MAKVQGILIQAEEMTRDLDNQIITLSGNVQIVYKGTTFSSNKANINLKSRSLEATGNVEINDIKSKVYAQSVIYDLESSTAVIYNGLIESGSISLEGEVLNKLGNNEYLVANSSYTTCQNCPATWSFNGSTIRAELGGYAYIKNFVLKVTDFPIFWFPYLIVPLKSERQSGFLIPTVSGSQKGGIAISESFFWAISPSQDASLTAKWYELRGMKPLVSYNYFINNQSYGDLNFAYINDRVFRSEERFQNYLSDEQKNNDFHRWFVKYNHFHTLPEGFIQRAQINLASDLQYAKDYEEETKNYGDPAMENRFSLTKNSEVSHWHIDSSYYVNFLHGNPIAENKDAVHRLPEIQYSLTPQNFLDTNWLYSFDVEYSNFIRFGNAYDDLTSAPTSEGTVRRRSNTCNTNNFEDNPNCKIADDGKFDPYQDLLRTGQRFDFKPSIYYPFNIASYIDFLPRLSYRETHYNFNIDENSNSVRRLLKSEISAKTHLSRIYGDLESLKGNRIKHDIQPEISYSVIPWIDHRSHPFFGFTAQTEVPTYTQSYITDGDLNGDFGIQFDYNDRIYNRNILTYAITNKWIEKYWEQDTPQYRQFATLKLSQTYDFNEVSRNRINPQPWSDLSLYLNLKLDHFSTTSLLNYYTYQKVTDASTSFKVWDDWGKFIQIGLSRKYQITRGLTTVDFGVRTEDYVLDSGLVTKYLNLVNRFVFDGNPPKAKQNKALKSWAYIAQIKPPGECWSIRLINYLPVDGDTRFSLDFQFPFDGKPIPITPATEIDKLTF